MRRRSAAQPKVPTRDRILNAAVLRFSRHSYEETGLRDIAADVGVDVAYVHRCFGSKQRLFAEAVKVTVQADRIFADMTDGLANTLAKQVFIRDSARKPNQVGPLDILIHSLSSREAADILREVTLQDVVDPLSRRLNDPSILRAALIIAFLTGISIWRNVLRVDALREAEHGGLQSIIAAVIEGITNKDDVVPSHRPTKRKGPGDSDKERHADTASSRAVARG